MRWGKEKVMKNIGRLTSPDDWGHRRGGVLPACYWSAPPRWSPTYKEQEVDRFNSTWRGRLMDEHPP